MKIKSEDLRQLQEKNKSFYLSPVTIKVLHYLTLCLLGLLSWGMAWSAWGDNWRWDGPWFKIAAVGVVAWASGLVLQATTTLPPLLAALLTGIIARQFNILDMRQFIDVDNFLRKIYPCLILGKNSLGWNPSYMKQNWKQIAVLGLLPWNAEVLAMTVCTHLLLGFPLVWGIFLGSVYASLTVPVIMPLLMKIGTRPHVNWPLLVGSAGGIDLFLSVGINGVIYSYIFGEASDVYRYVKAAVSLFVGVVLGFAWGWVCGHVPHPQNFYVQEMRILMILFGGFFGSFFTDIVEWRGTAGVAVLICNDTATHYWMKDGWQLNKNPASTAYRVMWAAAEPLVFAYTGTYFVAVLSPLPINALVATTESKSEKNYAEDVLRIIVEAILVTTPVGFLLTHYLAPRLLKYEVEIALREAPKSPPAYKAQQKRNFRRKPKPRPRPKFRPKPKSRPKPKTNHK